MRKYFPAEHLAGKSYTLQMTMVFLAFLFLFLFAGCGREVTGDGEAPGANVIIF